MSVVGFDLGNQSCYIAVARQGGIETIANEYSDRCTPTYVSFQETQRSLGTSAKQQQISNIKNTVWAWKRFIGRKFSDPVVQNEMKYAPFNVVEGPDGMAGFKVRYLNEEHVFTAQQLTACMLTKLKDISEANLKTKVVDCVLSVPTYFTDSERRAMLDATRMAGLNCLRLFNDTTSTALAYGIYKQDLPAPEDKPRNVIFVDMGHTDLQISAVAFNKGKLKVLATVCDPCLGGRDIDRALVEHFTEEFKKKYKIDAKTNAKATIRLGTECEKLKKLMSANATAIPLNIECFMNDKDVTSRFKRSDMEDLIKDVLQRTEATMKAILAASKLSTDDIYAVEIVGGSTRVPAIKSIVKDVFKQEPSTTLNADEAISRGTALQCAILSPTFRVRDFSITDCQPYPITLSWQAAMEEEKGCSDMEVFTRYSPIPMSKMLTFYRTEKFALDAKYSTKSIPFPTQNIGSFLVDNISPQANGESSKIKVKVRVNIHGIFNVNSASIVEKIETMEEEPVAKENSEEGKDVKKEEPMEQENGPTKPEEAENSEAKEGEAQKTEEPMQTGEPNQDSEKKDDANEEKEKTPKKPKVKTKTTDLPIIATVPSMSKTDINLYFEKECQMIQQDRIEKEKQDAKNAVEEYVYEMRDKLSTSLENYITDKDRTTFSKLLDDTENWLYEDGEDVAKKVYVEKLAELKKLGDPVVARYREHSDRPAAFNAMGRDIQMVKKAIDLYKAKDEKYDHLSEDDMKKVEKCWNEKSDWLNKNMNACGTNALYLDPPILVKQIRQTTIELNYVCNPILNKPKPKPKEEPPKDDKKDEQKADGDAEMKSEEEANGNEKESTPPNQDAKTNVEMELD